MRPAVRALGPRLFVVALLVLAAALRGHHLADADLWWDEALAVWAVRKPLLATTAWTASDVHPPIFFWLLWAWRRLGGESEYALRALIAGQGVLVVAVAHALGRRVGGRRAGAWAAALAATSPLLVWWSQELRMYTTAALALALAAYAACRWAAAPSAPGARRWLAGFAVAGIATLHAVYLAGAGLAALAAATLYQAVRRRVAPTALRDWLVANALVVVGFLPWALYAGGRMDSWRSAVAGPSPGFVAELWAALLAHGTSTDIAGARAATAAFWLCAALAAWLARAPGGTRAVTAARPALPASMLAAFLVIPPAVVWLATQPRALFYSPSIEARYFVPFAAPVYALLGAWLGRAEARPGRRRAAWLAGAGALAVGIAFLPAHFDGRRRTATLDAMALAIWSQAEPGDLVLLVSGNRYPLFLYHYERQWVHPAGRPTFELPADRPPDPAGRPHVVPFPDRGSGTLPAGWRDDLAARVEGHARVWLAAYGRDLQDPGGEVEAWLAERFHRVLSEGYGPDGLHLFAREDRPPVVTGLSSRWPGTVWLGRIYDTVGATGTWLPLGALPTRRARAGDALELTLFSTGDERPGPQRAWLHAWPGPREHVEVRAGPLYPIPAPSESPADAGLVPIPRRSRDERVLRHRFALPIDARTPGGAFDLTVRGPDGQGGNGGGLPIRILDAHPLVGGPSRVVHEVVVGGYALLQARAATAPVYPGQALVLDLIWAPRAADVPRPPDPTVFAHLLGPPRPDGDTVWAVADGPPSVGGWDLGNVRYFDRHVLAVPADAPPGDYLIEVGMYDPAGGARHAVAGDPDRVDTAGRRVLLGTVRVR